MLTKKKPGRGGRRAGAGRKSADGAEIAGIMTVAVDQDTLDIVAELGQGNDSLGVRMMAAELLSLRSTAPPPRKELKSVATPAATPPMQRNPFMRKSAAPTQDDDGWADVQNGFVSS